ncbi:hypothetical protein MANY_00220 [Mycolicibacterium anyangense]|uniref:Uncharacterized protein n=1 Tax=Mycolicibacterium anyangense TaxID=1431246 RepID=A0A6N4W217_9MYCO|nr:hypothetical protein MANY_00220 [Mycolicibacterium anyangense]
MAPEIPSAAPASSAISIRGIRHCSTTVRSKEVLVPSSTRITSVGLTGYVPEPTAHTATNAATASMVPTAATVRQDTRTEARPLRTTA